MKILALIIMFTISIHCLASDTLDCTGKPYSLMMHVGNENGDVLSDVLLFKEGREEAIEIYFKNDLHINSFIWINESDGNSLSYYSVNKEKITIKFRASNEPGVLIIGERPMT